MIKLNISINLGRRFESHAAFNLKSVDLDTAINNKNDSLFLFYSIFIMKFAFWPNILSCQLLKTITVAKVKKNFAAVIMRKVT